MNDALASILRSLRFTWKTPGIVRSENTGTLLASTGRPDILIVEPNVAAVAIETEVLPAATVEIDALSRLGVKLTISSAPIYAVIAVRLSLKFRLLAGSALTKAMESDRSYEYCLFTLGSDGGSVRWPTKGWLRGGVDDLALLAQSAAVPPNVIDSAADKLVAGVTQAAAVLEQISSSHASSTAAIATELRQEDGIQTRRMASAILTNALVFHDALAGGAGQLSNVKGIEQLRGLGLTRTALLAEWRKILKVNYWPIFDVARRIMEHVPAAASGKLIEHLASTATDLLESNLMRSHDLTGAVFQRLIADRKFLAAYYTTPASAALLAGLAVRRESNPSGRPWGDEASLKELKIGDFACGTGTLLSTVYQRVGQLFELADGEAAKLHPKMMSSILVGCDVLPAAAHLTASMLASAHPGKTFGGSSIITMGYGIQADGGVSLGSLDLLNPQARIASVAPPAKAAGGSGESAVSSWAAVADTSFDLVLMNPPFTRPTGHEGDNVGVRNPMFAAFNASKKEQTVMAREARRLTNGTAYHGNAGEASAFAVLAEKKLKPGGTLGLILPLSFMVGDAWSGVREMITSAFGNIVVVTISGAKDKDLSFSADTNMGECMLVARKGFGPSSRATFVVLKERPKYPMVGSAIAAVVNELLALDNIRPLERGPVGGTLVKFGKDTIGQVMTAQISGGNAWSLARISDLALAQSAYQVSKGRLWLPGSGEDAAVSISMAALGNMATIGPYHMDINASGSNGAIRGPFEVEPTSSPSGSTYPILWAQNAATQKTLLFEHDSEGILKSGGSADVDEVIREKAKALLGGASHCHFNRDFRFNSQSLSMQFTTRKSIGGRGWLGVRLGSENHEKALVLWANTTIGLLLHWWHANKQQAGRGSVGKAWLAKLPAFDVRALSSERLTEAVLIFDEMCSKSLLPMHKVNLDYNRHELDRRFFGDVLDVDLAVFGAGGGFEVLREKLAAEPSVRGAKT